MLTTTARVVVNVAVMGSLLIGYRVGEDILVHRVGDRWADERGIILPDECLSFDL